MRRSSDHNTLFGQNSMEKKNQSILERYGEDQKRWHEFSQQTTLALLSLLPSYPGEHPNVPLLFPDKYTVNKDELFKTQVMCAYAFLAQARAQYAKEQGHGLKENKTDHYGMFRPENFESFESVFNNNDKQVWAQFKDAIFKQVIKLVDQIKIDSLNFDDDILLELNDYNVSVEKIESDEDEEEGICYVIMFKSPEPEDEIDGHKHSTATMKIQYSCYEQDKEKNTISVIYTGINKYNMIGDCHLAERYFNACRQSDTTEDFMLNAGRLTHLLCQLLWVKRGNAAITGWLIDALAKEKKIELGPYTLNDNISWDWKALVTPNREEYANWFASNCFSYINAPEPAIKKNL